MTAGAISGNTATSGGGVFVGTTGSFTKTGGIIYGDSDTNPANGNPTDNTATYNATSGHAVFYYDGTNSYYRNTTLGAGDGISTSNAANWES
ncbi:MAG: hypothetical protein LBQ55_11595 [Treponema sp.]|jgi:hypothetical protein|nr:hypothetical protein [Treponema sp.]